MKERLATVLYAIFTIVGLLIFGLSTLFLFSGDDDGIWLTLIGAVFALIVFGIGWSMRYVITGNKNSFLLNLIKNVSPKKKLTLFAIANLPIYDLTNQTEPLDFAEKQSTISDDENINSLVFSGILAFQLFIYLELIKARFGKEVSKMAEEHMCLTLDRFSEEDNSEPPLGQGIKRYIDIVRKIYETDPVTVEVEGKEITFPKEYDIAMGFFYYMEDSPYYSKGKTGDELPDIKDDLDIKFSDLLEKARIGIAERYAPILLNENMELDEASSLGVRVEDKLAA